MYKSLECLVTLVSACPLGFYAIEGLERVTCIQSYPNGMKHTVYVAHKGLEHDV